MNRIRIWLCALACCALAACGGGGSDGPQPLPPAVTATVSAAGSDVEVTLAQGGSATLEFPAGAFAADREVTVTPLAAQGDEWTRFSVDPGLAALGAPLKLRVRPPSAITAGTVPVLQIVTAEGMELLVTRRLPDGTLEATLAPQLATLLSAPPGRRQALAAKRPLAEDAGTTTVAGTGFLAVCQAPESVLADAMRVIHNASSASAVRTALSTLALVADRCVQPGVLDEAGLLRVNLALQDLAQRLPGIYADAMAAWRGLNFLEIEAQFEPFKRGVRRLFALCAAAGEIGANLVCPLSTDFEPEYTELANGFAAAANEQQYLGSLRLLFDQLVPLVAEVRLYGLEQADEDLQETLALIADRLMDRAYALCSHGELFEWRVFIENGGYSNRSSRTLAKAIAHCGVHGEVTPATSDDAGGWVRGSAQAIEPGTIDGAGRTAARTVEARFDSGRVIVGLNGPALRCSRVIGTPEARNEKIELRVGSTVLSLIDLVRSTDGNTTSLREAALDLPTVLAQIGRPADSTDPIVIEAWRKAAGPLACVDSSGGTLELRSEDEMLFALTVTRSDRPALPLHWAGTVTLKFEHWQGWLTVEDGFQELRDMWYQMQFTATFEVDLPPGQTVTLPLAGHSSGAASFTAVLATVVDVHHQPPGTSLDCTYAYFRSIEDKGSGGVNVFDGLTLKLEADGRYTLGSVSPRPLWLVQSRAKGTTTVEEKYTVKPGQDSACPASLPGSTEIWPNDDSGTVTTPDNPIHSTLKAGRIDGEWKQELNPTNGSIKTTLTWSLGPQ